MAPLEAAGVDLPADTRGPEPDERIDALYRCMRGLDPLSRALLTLSTQLAIALGAVMLLGTFLADHWRVPRFAVPAILLDIAAVMLIASTAAQLRVLSTIDFGHAVVTIQSMLTELAVRRAREVRWQWLLMLPLWTPLAVVVMQGIFGVDLYRWFGAPWIAANVAVSVVLTPLVVWLGRRLDNRQHGFATVLTDDIAGRRLSDALKRLDEVVAFGTEKWTVGQFGHAEGRQNDQSDTRGTRRHPAHGAGARRACLRAPRRRPLRYEAERGARGQADTDRLRQPAFICLFRCHR